MVKYMAILIGLALLASIAAAQPPDATQTPQPKLETVLPENTLLLITFDNSPVNNQSLKGTVYYRTMDFIFSKETMSAFSRIFGGRHSDGEDFDPFAEMKKEIGVTPSEMMDLFNGEVAFAMIDIELSEETEEPKVNLIVKADIADLNKAKEVLNTILKKERPDSVKTYTMTDPLTVVFTNKSESVFASLAGQAFVFGTDKKTVERTIKSLSGKTDNSFKTLSASPLYQQVNRKIQGKEPTVTTFYINSALYSKLSFDGEGGPDFSGFFKTIGLDTAKAMGSSVRVKDGRFYETTYFYAPDERKGIIERIGLPQFSDKDGITLTQQSDIGPNLLSAYTYIAVVAAIAIPNLMNGRKMAYEASAIAGLKMMTAMEAVWRQQDADGNGIKDYWTLDVSCFNRMYRADNTTKINFIDISFAMADAAPFSPDNDKPFGDVPRIEDWTEETPTPKSGYFFKAMKYDESDKPFCVNTVGTNKVPATHTSRFAFVAYPAEYGVGGTLTYIIDNGGTVYAKDLGPNPDPKELEQWPAETAGGSPTAKGWFLAE